MRGGVGVHPKDRVWACGGLDWWTGREGWGGWAEGFKGRERGRWGLEARSAFLGGRKVVTVRGGRLVELLESVGV